MRKQRCTYQDAPLHEIMTPKLLPSGCRVASGGEAARSEKATGRRWLG